MSNSFYVALAYATTYFVLAGYALYSVRKRAQARAALQAELNREEV